MPSEENVIVETAKSASGLLAPGCLVDGKFEILGLLGKGGMSVVYKARHIAINRVVALKMMHGSLLAKRNSIQRFQREAATASSLHHENIIEVSGFGVFDEQPYMAIEFLEGESLSDLLKSQGRFPIERAVPIFVQICDALNHAHEHGVVHRDLKPSNVMLIGSNETVKLVDFGIAKVLPDSGKELQKLTQAGEVFGSACYMSPEQCQGIAIDTRSDIYSMGCLMYEVLTGQAPFVGNTFMETMSKHLGEEPSFIDFLSADMNKVFCQALAKDPSARFQTIRELKAALLVADQDTQLTDTRKPVQRLISTCSQNLSLTAALLSTAIVAGGVYCVTGLPKADQAKQEQGSLSTQRTTWLYWRNATKLHQTDPRKIEESLLTASGLAAKRQEPRYRIQAISALAAFYNDKAWWLDVPVGRRNVGAMNRQLAEAKQLLIALPEFKKEPGHPDTMEPAFWIASCADNSTRSSDKEFFLQHAYNILVSDKRNEPNHDFQNKIVAIGSKYATVLRNNGKFQKALDVESVVKRHQKQQNALKDD